jgi:hypothetical protein
MADDYTFEEIGNVVRQLEPLHSPIMTVLLDVPWREVTRSGWPFAAIMHQLSVRRQENTAPAFDAIIGPIQQFHAALKAELAGSPATVSQNMAEAARQYLEATSSSPEHQSGLGTATAALTIGLSSTPVDVSALETAQNIVKQIVASPVDLDAALMSHWPVFQVWSLYRF